MIDKSLSFRMFILILSTLAVGALCNAQSTRTWVSGLGDDANPCSRTLPCKSFAAAVSKTTPAGEIDVLDSGSFGAVTITKSISIEAAGVIAGIQVSEGNAITVNAGSNDVVVLRGLTLEGLSQGSDGIEVLSAGAVHIEDCTVNNFASHGIESNTAGPTQMFVKDTVVRNECVGNGVFGIYSHPRTGGSSALTIDGVRIEHNGVGIRADDDSKVTIRNSIVSDSLAKGVISYSSASPTYITIESSVITSNAGSGVVSNGLQSSVVLSNVTITGNLRGLQSTAIGNILSFGNNRITGNVMNGSPTAKLAQT